MHNSKDRKHNLFTTRNVKAAHKAADPKERLVPIEEEDSNQSEIQTEVM